MAWVASLAVRLLRLAQHSGYYRPIKPGLYYNNVMSLKSQCRVTVDLKLKLNCCEKFNLIIKILSTSDAAWDDGEIKIYNNTDHPIRMMTESDSHSRLNANFNFKMKPQSG